jgi:hypothetical protein
MLTLTSVPCKNNTRMSRLRRQIVTQTGARFVFWGFDVFTPLVFHSLYDLSLLARIPEHFIHMNLHPKAAVVAWSPLWLFCSFFLFVGNLREFMVVLTFWLTSSSFSGFVTDFWNSLNFSFELLAFYFLVSGCKGTGAQSLT